MRIKANIFPILGAIALVTVALGASGDMIQLIPSKDNTLYEDSSGNISDGQGRYFYVGETLQGSLRRGLIAFDVNKDIPAGSTIVSVMLQLNMSKKPIGIDDPTIITFHWALADWGEGNSDAGDPGGAGTDARTGDATWVHRFFDTEEWMNEGGDFSETTSASLEVDSLGRHTVDSTVGMVADVQGWVDQPSSNFGWLLKGNEDIEQSARRFDTRENSNQANRPLLTVEFDLPSENAAGRWTYFD